MRNDVLVYISGPMTAKGGRTIEQNTADGVAVYLDLLLLDDAFQNHPQALH